MRKLPLILLALVTAMTYGYAREADRDTIPSQQQNSAIYLNASSDSKPREISLGLPTNTLSAVQIFEDGLPVSYYIYQLLPYKSWHGGASARSNGTMGPMETALRYGEINNYVDSYNKIGSDSFRGAISYTIGSYGQHKIDFNLSGPIGKGWKYSVSTYQNFDPGSNACKMPVLRDRHQFYKGVITKDFNDGNGRMSLVYQYVNYVTILDNYGPFIFVGDGSVRPYNGFSLGTNCYIPDITSFKYMDFKTGEMKEHPYRDIDETHHVTFTLERRLTDNIHLDVRSRLKTGRSSRGAGSISGIQEAKTSDGYTYAGGDEFSGMLQRRNILQFEAFETTWMNNAEIQFSVGKHDLRAGLDYQFNHSGDVTSSLNIAHEVTKDPRVLYLNGEMSYNFNSSGEYYDGFENKAAIYIKDDWQITPDIFLAAFLRAEYQGMHGNSANNIGEDTSNTRYPGFNLTKGRTTGFTDNFLNGSAGVDFEYRIVGGLSLKAQAIFTRASINSYHFGGAQLPSNDPTDTRFAQAGLSYVNDWLNIVSQFVYISQSNYKTRTTFQHALQKEVGGYPIGYIEAVIQPITYGVESFGWTTDAIINPFNGFNLHLQFTLRDPKYRNFVFNPTFSDGVTEHYDFSGNNVTGLHKMEFTMDPSYTIRDWRFWLTARYISKQFINKTNSLYFNGRWETFGGIDYKLNRNCRFSLNVINILNQKGASGNISSADLVTDPSGYADYLMAGTFIRPFTVELGVNIDF